MRRRNLIIAILAVLIIVGYLGYTQVYAPSVAPTPTPELAADLETVIWASGEVVPAKWADLSFPISGQVVELPVAEGATIAAGTVLARLDTTELEDGVAAAEAALNIAQANLARVKAGPRPAEIAQAEEGVHSAQAARDAAQAQQEQAQAELKRLLAGASPEEVEAAAATLMKAEAALRQAQAEYDKIAWAGDVGDTPQALALESATLDYDVAKANYQALVRGARPEEIEAAQAGVAAARANLAQAEAGVGSAQAALELLQAGATPQEIAAAEATVAQAEANLAAARTALNQAILIAPFDGTVSEVNVRVGEQVNPVQSGGQPVIVLGDLSTMRVETTDLRETDVERISIGQTVDITFDALPDTLLKGQVVYISPKASSEQGGVNYTTIIDFNEFDPRLRWGMTAYVNITVD
ncbi:MAG: HlyD family efflux transporter periplasmic adaptor subunit [Anaerolineae bacterium]|jgi:HlyD family secretion protein